MDTGSILIQEDKAIKELISNYGVKKWTLVAKKLAEDFKIKGRSGKQCRERWHNQLDPNVQKFHINEEEEKIIFEAQNNIGNKWADIAKLLPGRTDNIVKNHYYSTLRRQLRKVIKEAHSTTIKETDEISIDYLYKIITENNISESILDNQNVINKLSKLKNFQKTQKKEEQIKTQQEEINDLNMFK